jgi:drug/metabolite transporter (DMT)-like permease
MNKKKIPGHLALFVAYVIFGLNIPISRSVMPDTIDPFALTYFRMTGGAALFWLLSLFVKKEKVSSGDLMLLFLASIFALILNQTSFIAGLSMTTPVDASIIQTILPVVSMFLAAFIQKEPITWKKFIGVLIGLSGTLLLISSHAQADGGNRNVSGNLLVLCSVISFSLYLTLFKNLILRYSPVTLMKWMFLFAVAVCLPFSYKAVAGVDYEGMSAGNWMRIAFVVVMATFVSYLLIPVGQKVLRPTTVSMYNYLQPVTASMAGVVMGLAVFEYDSVLSAILVFTGVYIVTTSKSRADLEREKQFRKIETGKIR